MPSSRKRSGLQVPSSSSDDSSTSSSESEHEVLADKTNKKKRNAVAKGKGPKVVKAPKLPAGLTGASCDHEDYETRAYRRTQRFLAVPFVLVCAFRAFFPTIYLFRHCFIDSPLSNILAARLLASVAEVCYVTQVSLALRRTSSSLHEAAYEQQRRAGTTNGFRASCSHIATQWAAQGIVLAIICETDSST